MGAAGPCLVTVHAGDFAGDTSRAIERSQWSYASRNRHGQTHRYWHVPSRPFFSAVRPCQRARCVAIRSTCGLSARQSIVLNKQRLQVQVLLLAWSRPAEFPAEIRSANQILQADDTQLAHQLRVSEWPHRVKKFITIFPGTSSDCQRRLLVTLRGNTGRAGCSGGTIRRYLQPMRSSARLQAKAFRHAKSPP